MRLGVFGGTFDPVHVGHLVAAVNAAYAAALDEVLMVVANRPWQKVDTRQLSSAADRLALVAAAVEANPRLVASDIELRRGGTSYTADTLAQLKRERPGDELFVVVGADVAAQLHTWERHDEVAEAATLVVVNRPTVTAPHLAGKWRVIEAHMPAMDVSSTELRQRAADGRPLDFLIPAPAIRFIAGRAMYSRST